MLVECRSNRTPPSLVQAVPASLGILSRSSWPRYAGAEDASPRRAGSSCGLCSSVPATGQHPSSPRTSPRQVHAYGLDVHMSTIYRFLDELEELGVVSHSHLGHGPAVYDISPVGHFHLVCEVCGAVTETPDALLAALALSLKARYGFSIDPHHFAMAGRCKRCSG